MSLSETWVFVPVLPPTALILLLMEESSSILAHQQR